MVELANEGLHLPDMRRWDSGAYAAKKCETDVAKLKYAIGNRCWFRIYYTSTSVGPVYNVPSSCKW
jgi:hypothetical protein